MFRKWILVVSVVVILFNVGNVRGGLIIVALMCLGSLVYYHVRMSLFVEHVLVIILQ